MNNGGAPNLFDKPRAPRPEKTPFRYCYTHFIPSTDRHITLLTGATGYVVGSPSVGAPLTSVGAILRLFGWPPAWSSSSLSLVSLLVPAPLVDP